MWDLNLQMMDYSPEIFLVLFNRNMLPFTGPPCKSCIICPKENCCCNRRFCRALKRSHINKTAQTEELHKDEIHCH